MREIGSDTGGVDNIVEGELVDERAGLEEEGERLERLADEGVRGVAWELTWPMPPEAPRTTAFVR